MVVIPAGKEGFRTIRSRKDYDIYREIRYRIEKGHIVSFMICVQEMLHQRICYNIQLFQKLAARVDETM